MKGREPNSRHDFRVPAELGWDLGFLVPLHSPNFKPAPPRHLAHGLCGLWGAFVGPKRHLQVIWPSPRPCSAPLTVGKARLNRRCLPLMLGIPFEPSLLRIFSARISVYNSPSPPRIDFLVTAIRLLQLPPLFSLLSPPLLSSLLLPL